MPSLNPAGPVLPIGVCGRFWAAACVHSVASPNRLKPGTKLRRIFSKKKQLFTNKKPVKNCINSKNR
ncbi:MAG: hypothetical protein EA408_09370 [Marinilabiliales bacterium]|nr:MAG: hypothetical protein EA408_09370 [Marinilabiliales bacterium]